MSLRCLSVIAAVAQPAIAIQSNLLNGEESHSGVALSAQMRQYSLLHRHEEAADGVLVDSFDRPKPANLVAGLTARRLGASVSLTEDGYKAVASLRSKEAMEAFAERLLAEEGLKVKDVNMLRRVMPFYNGECATQSMTSLRTELREATAPHGCHAAWVTKASSAGEPIELKESKQSDAMKNVKPQRGDVAPLNQEGYLAVAALKSDDEMKTFIRRISKSEGLSVMNEGGLSGFVKYYSGVCARQSFEALVKELRSVQPVAKTTMISYELQPDEDLYDLQQRIANATGLDLKDVEIVSEGEGVVPDATNLKKSLAEKMGVDEERLHVMKFDDAQQSAKAASARVLATPMVAKEGSSLARSGDSAKRAMKTVVVTVTSRKGASVEDALEKLASDSSKGMRIHRQPVTLTASIPKPESCGGGWVAPKAEK